MAPATLHEWRMASLPLRKAWNLITSEQRRVYWKSVDRRRQGWVPVVRSQVKKLFIKEGVAVEAAVAGGAASGDAVVNRFQKDWAKLYRSIYLNIGTDFARSVHNEVAKATLESVWESGVMEYLDPDGGNNIAKIVGIGKVSKEKIRAIIQDGVEEGKHPFAISQDIKELYAGFSTYRADRIARTEVIAASNLGGRLGAKSTGLVLEKEWIATQDERTRDGADGGFDHLSMDGQFSPIDDPWEVGGENLMFPGDSSLGASPGNTINCRCVEGYRRSEEDE